VRHFDAAHLGYASSIWSCGITQLGHAVLPNWVMARDLSRPYVAY
jgi:hypothetical protein